MSDAFTLIERYNWTLQDIEDLAFCDFVSLSDAATMMYSRERKADEAAARGR